MTIPEFSQLVTPFVVLAGVLVSWDNKRNIRRQAENVEKIEKATNSMKDALVASTAKASHLEGVAEGKASRVRPDA